MRRPRAEDVLDLLGQLGAREAAQLQPADAAHPRQLGDERAQRIVAVELVDAKGRDQLQRRAAGGADEEGEEVARRAVGPVEVLEHEDDRPLLRQPQQQREQQREQAALTGALGRRRRAAAVAAAQLRPQRRQLAPFARAERVERVAVAQRRSQRGHDRRVRQLAVGQLDALADQHELSGGGRAPFQLADQAALADAGVAGDEHRSTVGFERRQLGGATDEPLARDALGHRPIIACCAVPTCARRW